MMRKPNVIAVTLSVLLGLAACGDDHDHGDHGHDHGSHNDHDDHGGHGHPHNGGGERPGQVYTHFTDKTELFVEFPALTVGMESPFAAHFTEINHFKPVATGKVIIVLADLVDSGAPSAHSGTADALVDAALAGKQPEERFMVDNPSVPGIFRPVAIPKVTGQRRLSVILETPEYATTHQLGTVTVYPNVSAIPQAEDAEDPGTITFLKEQQWPVTFEMAQVVARPIRSTISATATLKPRLGGEAWVGAPVEGHVILAADPMPTVGQTVEPGQTLAIIVPHLSGEVDPASLELAVQKALTAHQLAARELTRLEGLLAQNAVPEKRVAEARSTEKVAAAELAAAERRLRQFLHNPASNHTSQGMAVRAPIQGIINEINASPGLYAGEGSTLFHVVDTQRLWLEARVAEADVARLQTPTSAWFTVTGFTETFDLGTEGRVVGAGAALEPETRTLPLIFEVANPTGRLKSGMFATAHIVVGEPVEGLAVPASALIDDNGLDVVYVQLDGEHFTRRIVQRGSRDGEWVAISSGLTAGEWVVSRGANLVRLAAASGAVPAHGHAH
jgi:membrane fusion protein, heavy metal efflux system